MSDQPRTPLAGTEGPRGHEAGAPVEDRKIPARVFLAIGVLLGVLAIIYWSTAYEEAGTVMLLLAAGLGLWIGVYLWLHTRGTVGPVAESPAAPGDAGPEPAPVVETGRFPEPGVAAGPPGPGAGAMVPVGTGTTATRPYLPHASAWPFAIGVGAAAVANGLVLGLWIIVPGVALLVLGIGGFVRQTRRRD